MTGGDAKRGTSWEEGGGVGEEQVVCVKSRGGLGEAQVGPKRWVEAPTKARPMPAPPADAHCFVLDLSRRPSGALAPPVPLAAKPSDRPQSSAQLGPVAYITSAYVRDHLRQDQSMGYVRAVAVDVFPR